MGIPYRLVKAAAVTAAVAAAGSPAFAGMTASPKPLATGYTPVPMVSPLNFTSARIPKSERNNKVRNFCSKLSVFFQKYGWKKNPCREVEWRAELRSAKGDPLIYKVFGDGEETTLVLGGVHGDELTPTPLTFRFARHLARNPELYEGQNIQVVIAPLVNPDGFLRDTPVRTNAHGVDLNRNFFTMDWYRNAEKLWKTRQNRSPRRFPGHFPNSEVETLFQIGLIDEHRPDKILSIHAPLGFLDYDGPGSQQESLSLTEKRAKQLVRSISKKSRNYRIVDYSFFPGSLGNYAGNERHIPTVTLELETTDPDKLDAYWKKFLPGLLQSIHYPFSKGGSDMDAANASQFSLEYQGPDHAFQDPATENSFLTSPL